MMFDNLFKSSRSVKFDQNVKMLCCTKFYRPCTCLLKGLIWFPNNLWI
jgi:hypothetical protein